MNFLCTGSGAVQCDVIADLALQIGQMFLTYGLLKLVPCSVDLIGINGEGGCGRR